MEALGAAASILAVASAGIQISLKLIAFADQVSTAPKRIQNIGTDVSVTAGTLQELGELMEKLPKKKSAEMFNLDQVRNIEASSARCQAIFDELKDILGKASRQLRDVYQPTSKSHDTSPKIKLSRLERTKWPFLQPSMEPLLSALRDAKGTLTLILQVVHLRHAHTTASLDREEQNDLIRMIAAMRRQQLGSLDRDKGGVKALDARDNEDSDSGDPSEVRTALEAWYVTPNTLPDSAFRHFYITPIPVSQQQLIKISPQDFREVTSIIDSLSPPEWDAILEILGMRHPHSNESSIRSISSQSWTGFHDIFGKVVGRKFKLIIERRVGISKSNHTERVHMTARQAGNIPQVHRHHSDSNTNMYDSLSDDGTICPIPSVPSIPSPPSVEHRMRHQAPAPPMSPHERRRPLSVDESKRVQELEEKKRIEEVMLRKEQSEKKQKENPSDKPWTEPRPASESSDDDLVESLLTQYTNFEPGQPLVQVFADPPPTYDETLVIPKRVPRPY